MTEAPPPHGGQLRQIAERYGVPASALLDFSANINPDGPPPAVLANLRTNLDDPSVLNTYPDLDQLELKRALGRFAGVSSQTISVANGFVPLLTSALTRLGVRRCLLPVPAFSEYRRTLEQCGVAIVPRALTPDSVFRYDIDAFLTGDHDAILVANPQNPSGVLTAKCELLSLVEGAASRRMLVLLDEAFIDYAPEHSLSAEVERLPNLIVFRSVTKFFALPGLRVGYAIANSATTKQLHEHIAPWPISTLAAHAVAAGLEDEAFAERTRLRNTQRRGELLRRFAAIGVTTFPSAANFLLFSVPVPAASFWQRMIVEHSLVLRECSNYESLSPSYLRAAVRTDHENARLAEAFGHVLSQTNAMNKRLMGADRR